MNHKSGTTSMLGVAVRDVARLRRVAAIVARHGFGEVLHRMPLGKRLLRLGRHSGEQVAGAPAVRFTRLLAALGPTYIKLGQVLSMRPDLLPREYITALSTLQDQAPVIPFDDVKRVVEQGFGQPLDGLFQSFERVPLATASIGQIHVARTHRGQKVVVKVQRPGIEATIRGDLDLLYLAARGLEASIEEMKLMSPSGVVAEFEKGLLRELNFAAELTHLVRAKERLDPTRPLTVPEPIPELSCRTVLTMSHFEGRAVRELEPGSPPARRAVDEMIHAFCRGVFVTGFFHGDPHAGNILVGTDGTLCLLDWGLVGTLSPEQRDDLVTLVLGAMLDDAATVARVLLKMGIATQRVDIAALKRDIARVRAQYIAVGNVRELDAQGFVSEFAAAVGRFKVKLGTEYSVLVKATGTIEGLARELHPEVDPIAIARPYVEDRFSEQWDVGNLVQQALGGGIGLVSLLRTLPTHADQIIHDFETGNLQVRARTPELDRIPDALHRSASRLSLALFAACLSLCTVALLPLVDFAAPNWLHITAFALCATSALGGWTACWWWHWLGKDRALRLTPILQFFRRG